MMLHTLRQPLRAIFTPCATKTLALKPVRHAASLKPLTSTPTRLYSQQYPRMSAMQPPEHFTKTTGNTDPVWIHKDPYSNRPQFPQLTRDLETDVCIIGAGIAGISTAYELVTRGVSVVLIEARDVLSGETGRTSGHLASDLDDGYTAIAKKHGEEGAKAAADSHQWAINRVGELSKKLGIECEYRLLPGYDISQYLRGQKEHADDVQEIKADAKKGAELGLSAMFKEGFAVQGWDSKIDQRDAAIWQGQATFHPTKYLVGLLNWLKEQPNFSCYTNTRLIDVEEKGIELMGIGRKEVKAHTLAGNTITCGDAVEATCIPLQKLSVVAEMEYMRTYCIAVRVPKGSVEDCLLYDSAEAYKYIRLTECDEKDDYLVVGGGDHKVGQADTTAAFDQLEKWTRERFTQAGTTDYKWSGQVFEPVDFMAFIGLNQGKKHTYIVTGDSGNGLTHGVLAGKLIADQIQGVENPWTKLYNPSRLASIAKSLPKMVTHDVQINAQYKRFAQTDIQDIEDLVPGEGGVLNKGLSKPVAVYKDENGNVKKFSALCPHLQGVVCWNSTEKSWDCPVHGSRFSKDGVQLNGPAKAGLGAIDDASDDTQKRAIGV